jgi:putative hemolysin
MSQAAAEFHVRLAKSSDDMLAVQRLRYEVFVRELGGGGALVDHEAGLERDHLDPFFEHLLLIDTKRDDIVGVYRLMTADRAKDAGGFYSENEYDLTRLKSSGRRLLELGRSCLHADYRGGTGMYHLWSGLARYVAVHQIEVLFGVASFHGTNVKSFAEPLSLLHHRHLAPDVLRVCASSKSFQNMDLIDEAHLDRRAAMMQMPSLIKAYLRLGGCVGEGAYVDHVFNTIDVCLIMDTDQLSARHARIYNGKTLL